MVMSDFFESLPGILTVSLIFGGWVIVAVVSSVAKNWRKVHESEHLAALKQSMIERGMSPDDIERVLRAGPGEFEDDANNETTQFSKKLAEHGVPAPAMEQILSAFRTAKGNEKSTMAKTVVAMLDGGADAQQVMAVVRALNRTSTGHADDARYRDDPASFRN
jgi:hypothetical protein